MYPQDPNGAQPQHPTQAPYAAFGAEGPPAQPAVNPFASPSTGGGLPQPVMPTAPAAPMAPAAPGGSHTMAQQPAGAPQPQQPPQAPQQPAVAPVGAPQGAPEPSLELRSTLPMGHAAGEWVQLTAPGALRCSVSWSDGPPVRLQVCDEDHAWLATPQPGEPGTPVDLALPAGWYFVTVSDPAGINGRRFSLSVWALHAAA